jgi:DNA-binding MarR family transcriptional regulator
MSVSYETQNQDRQMDNYLWVQLQRARSVATRARNLELAQFGLTIEQMSILHSLLIKGGTASVDEIATNVVRQKNSVTTLLDRMAKVDLVKVERLATTKKYRIALTSKARNILDSVPRKSIEMLFSSFDTKEKEEIAKYLEQIVNTGLELLGENYVPPFLSRKSPTKLV